MYRGFNFGFLSSSVAVDASGGGTDYRSTIIGDSPVAYWRLGESSGTTASDEIGSSDGSYGGDVTLGVTGALSGVSDTSVSFAGSSTQSDGITVSSLDTADYSSGITIELWLNWDSSTGTGMPIEVREGNDGNDRIFFDARSSGTPHWDFNIAGTWYSATGAGVQDGWHLYAFTHDGTNAKTYRNGVLQNTTSASATTFDPDAMGIGQDGGGYNVFYGGIDEVAIYNSALSATELLAHYTVGRTVGGILTPDLLHWPLNDAAGTTIAALVGAGATSINGTLNGDYFYLDSTEDRFTSSADIAYGTNIVTVSFWFQTDNNNMYGEVFRSREVSNNDIFAFSNQGGWQELHIKDGSGNVLNKRIYNVLTANTWYHFVMVFDGPANSGAGDAKYYINKVEQTLVTNTNNKNGTSNFATDAFSLGGTYSDTPDFLMDDLRIYSGELTTSQIDAIYDAGRPVTFPSTNLVAFYKLDESSGDALDSSGNSKTFTEIGTVASTTGTIGGETVSVRTLDKPADKYFSRSDDADFDVGDGEDFTISFWAAASSSMGNYNSGGIFSKRNAVGASDAGYSIDLKIANSDTYIRYNGVSDGTTTVGDSNSSTGIATDTFAHYMMVFTADATVVTYVNNVQYYSFDASLVTGSLANSIDSYIGRRAYNSSGDIIADVTHLGFWKKALDSNERTALYNSGKVLAPAAPTYITLEASAENKDFSGYSSPYDLSVNYPAVSENDIMLMIVTTERQTNFDGTPPTGWTKVIEVDGTLAYHSTQGVYWKRASASAAASTGNTWSSFMSGGQRYFVWVGAYSGCVTSGSPIDASASGLTNYSTAFSIDITTVTDNAMILAVMCTDRNDRTFTWSDGTELVDTIYKNTATVTINEKIESTAGTHSRGGTFNASTGGTEMAVALRDISTTNNNFDFTVTTTTSSETFTIPCNNSGTFDATVDWGDGSTSAITAYNDADLAHTYATAGDHDISISGTFPNIYFNNGGDKDKVKSVTNLGSVGWTSFQRSFKGCSNMTSFDAGDCDTSSATSAREMFYNCTSLTSVDVSSLDTSSVTTMQYMFGFCSSITSLDLSNFGTGLNTSSVTNFENVFRGCSSVTSLDVSSFNTSSVTNLAHAFRDCSSLTSLDVSSFDTSNVTNIFYMFSGCSSLTTITGIEDFDITGLAENKMAGFLTSVTLSTTVYDELLVNYQGQTGYNNQDPNFGSSTYTAGSAAATARAALVTAGWSITDGGTA